MKEKEKDETDENGLTILQGPTILPRRSIIDELRASLKVGDEEMIDEIISANIWDLN